ncbi:DUF397 domain-containing protein [Streptomyces kronopolitis]
MAYSLPRQGWYKSTYSEDWDAACVEIRQQRSGVGVRDSKVPQGDRLAFSVAAWSAFISTVKTHQSV